MPTPSISNEVWERTRALAQIAIGTRSVDSSELSFERCIELLCGVPKFSEEGVDGSAADAHHEDWPHGVEITYSLADRDRPHRPHISSETRDRLNEAVRERYEMVPADDLDFEDRLSVLIDDVQKQFSRVKCTISVEQESS